MRDAKVDKSAPSAAERMAKPVPQRRISFDPGLGGSRPLRPPRMSTGCDAANHGLVAGRAIGIRRPRKLTRVVDSLSACSPIKQVPRAGGPAGRRDHDHARSASICPGCFHIHQSSEHLERVDLPGRRLHPLQFPRAGSTTSYRLESAVDLPPPVEPTFRPMLVQRINLLSQ